MRTQKMGFVLRVHLYSTLNYDGRKEEIELLVGMSLPLVISSQ
uniref:Uncharacterized protein n=1 Tax=Arundo donax TaxID=35708 RepID=A0A0A9ADV5_ARUDO